MICSLSFHQLLCFAAALEKKKEKKKPNSAVFFTVAEQKRC